MPITYKFLLKRLLACVYELLILVALWMLVIWLYMFFFGLISNEFKRFCLQFLLWLSAGVYLVLSWHKLGQTLAMRAWKLKIVNEDGSMLSLKQAGLRYIVACMLAMLFGLTFIWAFVDKQKLFLHDRLLATRCIQL
jgi:uncharacterized RDD family membrane protein YckC